MVFAYKYFVIQIKKITDKYILKVVAKSTVGITKTIPTINVR